MPNKQPKSIRLNLRVPPEVFEELDRYAKRSGLSRTQFVLYGATLGCRQLDQIGFPLEYLTPEHLKAAVEASTNVIVDRAGGDQEMKKQIYGEVLEDEAREK
jgi:hypothetical protein